MEFYDQEHKKVVEAIASARFRLRSIQSLRVVSFFAAVSSFFFLRGINMSLAIVSTVLLLVIFAWLIKQHVKMSSSLKLLQNRKEALEWELSALRGDWSSFNSGDDYRDVDHSYSHDLDLYGKGSLYQYLCRSTTVEGKKVLAHWLGTNVLDQTELVRRQNLVNELSNRPGFMLDVQALGMVSEESATDLNRLLTWAGSPLDFQVNLTRKIGIYLTMLFSFSLLFLVSFSLISGGLFALLFPIPIIFTGLFIGKLTKEYTKLGNQYQNLLKYAGLLSRLKEEELESALGKEIKLHAGRGDMAIGRLAKIMNAFDARNNFLVAIFFNIYFQWDLLSLWRLQNWHREFGPEVSNWMSAIGRFEALLSLARFRYNHQAETVFPTFSDEMSISGTKMGHPFISSENRIDNDFAIAQSKVAIITGANMAGKSTFLRTLGVNLILGMAGGPVVAKEMSFKPTTLCSSMRTADSLNSNESYFYNELKRLHFLIDRLEKGEELFVILDEILKGTNSVDKAQGSARFIKKLLRLPVTGVIATHDLSLCELKNDHPDRIDNLCFDVEIKEDDLHFDYKMRQGICSNMNATFLMKKLGITD